MLINSVGMLVGIPGNLLIVAVYATKRFRSSAHILIMGLAVADFSVCLIRPLDIFFETSKGLYRYHHSKFWCKGYPFIEAATSQCSVYIMALIAVERYFTVCRPHDHRTTLTPKRAALSIVACFTVAIVVCFPTTILSDNVVQEFTYEGVDMEKRCDRNAGGPRWFFLLQKSALNSLTFLALLTMIVLYTKVVLEVRRRTTVRPIGDKNASTSVFTDAGSTGVVSNHDDRFSGNTATAAIKATRFSNDADHVDGDEEDGDKSSNPDRTVSLKLRDTIGDKNSFSVATVSPADTTAVVSTNHDDVRKSAPRTGGRSKTTKMLLLTTAIFVVTYLPTVGMLLIPDRLFFENYYTQKRILVTAFFIIRNVYIFNHVINPILYGFVNKRFRDDCRKVMRRMKRCN